MVSQVRADTEGSVELLKRVEEARLTGLDAIGEERLGYRKERHGLRVHAVWAKDLSEEQLRILLEFRIAQYVQIGFADPLKLDALLAEGRPLSPSSPEDIHVVAASEDGKVLCSALLRAPLETDTSRRMADRDRRLFPVEEVHGSGVFDRLLVLPELPAVRVRELGGFVKRKTDEPFSELSLRAPVEVGVAMFRLAAERLALPVDAVVGDLESSVAKLNLDFFGARPVLVHGTTPRVHPDSVLGPRYEGRTVQPFAILTSDLTTALDRFDEVDRALERPGLRSLLALRSSLTPAERSTLWQDGFDGVDDTENVAELPAGAEGQDLHAPAEEILRVPLLNCLSHAEAVTLAGCMEEVYAQAGDIVIRRGEPEDAMYLVRSGTAVVETDGERHVRGAEFTAGDHFGEIAVLFGGPRTASVIAATPLRLWRLSSADYRRYLERVAEVDHRLTRIAAQRVHGRLDAFIRRSA